MLKKYPIVFLILFLAVGYAGISAKNIINANIDIAFDEPNYFVGFESVNTDYGISTYNEQSINFKTISLKNTNDVALLEFEIANKSLEYDAEATVNCRLKDTSSSMSEYLNIKTDINSLMLESGNGESGILTVQMKKTYTGTNGIAPELICTLTSKPVSRTTVGKKYVPDTKDPILNGADPVLDNEKKLVPVKISMDGTVTVADTTKRWYSYRTKSWANAVILIDSPSQTYNVNDIIDESDIESYFVWIPRYRYQIFNTGNYTTAVNSTLPTSSNAQEIQIVFEGKETATSKGTAKGSWLTHPAFINYNTNGIWVGKFETGYKGATTTTGAEANLTDSSKIIIKPNVYSWRNINVSNAFKSSINYASSLNSHMMRNTEWGAVAILSYSKYGINKEIRLNNNSSYLTGYAATDAALTTSGTDETKTLPYNTETGYLASSTGNISGIYDMSGGALEYVAGNKSNTIGNSGFTSGELTTYAEHLDIYPSNSTIITYNNRILGDATGEMGPFYKIGNEYKSNWYGDHAYFVNSDFPWFSRGGCFNQTSNTGQFNFENYSGIAGDIGGFRITLASSE